MIVMRALFAAFAVSTVAGAGQAEPFPRTKPLEPAEAVKAFRVQDGFRLELLAAEPLVTDPVAAAYDEDGRLYVVEMIDYPHVNGQRQAIRENTADPPIGRVRLLIDRDGDGVFDEGHIFAEKLSWPTGVAVWKGGVFVAATPDIWYFKDTDGDHRADVGGKVFTGLPQVQRPGRHEQPPVGPGPLDLRRGGEQRRPVRPADRPGRSRSSTSSAATSASTRSTQRVRGHLRRRAGSATRSTTGATASSATSATRPSTSSCPALPGAQPVSADPRADARRGRVRRHDPVFRISPPEPWRELRARRWAAVGKAMPRSELVGAGFLTSSSGVTVYRGDAYPAGLPRQPLPRRGRQQPDPPQDPRARRRDVPAPGGPTRTPSSSPRPTPGSAR